MELRVLRITFLSNFNLSRSFDFARYITIAEESNIIQMLHVDWTQWVVVLLTLVAVCSFYTVNGDDVHIHDTFLSQQCKVYADGDGYGEVGTRNLRTFISTFANFLIFFINFF
jgi:hypothetical protein